MNGKEKFDAVCSALNDSMNSIIVSALSFFAATIGVALYSKIDMVATLCSLMARGAIISMFVVILLLPAVLRVFDPLIMRTSLGFKGAIQRAKERLESKKLENQTNE